MVSEALLNLEACDLPAEVNPVDRYLGRVAAGASRETLSQGLEHLAKLASGGSIEARRFPWHRLTYRETSRLRAVVADAYTPAGTNLRIAALRGVLREAWRLELMSAEDYQRAADLALARLVRRHGAVGEHHPGRARGL